MATPSSVEIPSPAYDRKFFDTRTVGSLTSARVVAPLVNNLLEPTRVVDFGCGEGAWLKAFVELGVRNVIGFDGGYVSPDRLLIPAACFTSVDLCAYLSDARTPLNADLAICLEVAEHLPLRCSADLIETLTRSAPAVLFSAAVPGQGGTGHVNEQWPAFWSRLFERNGFVRTDPFRPTILYDRRVEWWYRQNIVLYLDRKRASESFRLRELMLAADEECFEIIRSPLFSRHASAGIRARTLLKELQASFHRWYAVWRTLK